MKNPLRKKPADALYAQLGRLIESTPNFKARVQATFPPLTPEQMLWLGRAEALVEDALGLSGGIEFKSTTGLLDSHRTWAADEIMKILYRALAAVEMELPAPASGAFVPATSVFDALKAVQKIFGLATKDVFVVDPYLDEKFVFEFAPFVPSGVALRLLKAGQSAPLDVAVEKWAAQYGASRPIAIKAAARKSLHDRLIAIDTARVWTVGQSFNALAVRSPTSFVEADAITASLKIAAYEKIWADIAL